MKDSFLEHLVEVNFAIGLICIAFFLSYLTRYMQITERLTNKQRQVFLTECINKGHPPNECATAWKVAKQYN